MQTFQSTRQGQEKHHQQPSNQSWAGHKPGTPGCGRRNERHTWSAVVQVSWLTGPEPSQPAHLETIDLSAGGLSIMTRSMVHTGTVGAVLLFDHTSNYQVRYFRVCHCRYDPRLALHVVGGQWIAQPDRPVSIDVKLTDKGYQMVVDRVRESRRRTYIR